MSETQYQAVAEALNNADHASAALGLKIHMSEFKNRDVAKDRARELIAVLTAVLSEGQLVDNGW